MLTFVSHCICYGSHDKHPVVNCLSIACVRFCSALCHECDRCLWFYKSYWCLQECQVHILSSKCHGGYILVIFIQYFTVNFFFLQDHFLKQGFDGTNHTVETLSFDLLKASIQYLIFLKAFYVCLYLISWHWFLPYCSHTEYAPYVFVHKGWV